MNAAEVLGEHQPWQNGFFCTGCVWTSKSGVITDSEEFGGHQLDKLKGAGYAVVELPKPSRPDRIHEGDIAAFYAEANGNHIRVRWSKDIVVDGNWYSAEEARDVAAALLAAADIAEVTA